MRAQLSALGAIFLDWCTQDTWIRSLAMSPQSLFFCIRSFSLMINTPMVVPLIFIFLPFSFSCMAQRRRYLVPHSRMFGRTQCTSFAVGVITHSWPLSGCATSFLLPNGLSSSKISKADSKPGPPKSILIFQCIERQLSHSVSTETRPDQTNFNSRKESEIFFSFSFPVADQSQYKRTALDPVTLVW